MGDYLFHEAITTEDGKQAEFPILVHELFSRPHSIDGVPEWASDQDIEKAVEKLEEKLGYELEKPDDWDDARMSDEEAENRVEFAKQAGFIHGEFHAR